MPRGRPRLPPGEGKDTTFLIRCSELELNRWKAAAETGGISAAEWVRRAANTAAEAAARSATAEQDAPPAAGAGAEEVLADAYEVPKNRH